MNKRQYLLTCLAEECAEVIQCASKINRFGLDDKQPNQEIDNKTRLTDESNDLVAIFDLLFEEEIIGAFDDVKIQAKKDKVEKYMKYSEEQGCLINEKEIERFQNECKCRE